MAGFRNSQKLVAGIGEVIYTVPAGTSATVSVQALGASGFILAAQQTAISPNSLLPVFSANTVNISVIAQGGTLSSGDLYTNTGQANAFASTGGNNTSSGMRIITIGQSGLTETAVNSTIRTEITLDYRLPLPNRFLTNDSQLGGIRAISFNTGTYPVPNLYTGNFFTGLAATTNPAFTVGGGGSASFSYYSIGSATNNVHVIGMENNGEYQVATTFPPAGTGALTTVTTTDSGGNNNNLKTLRDALSYNLGNNTCSTVYSASGIVSLFVGGFKTADAPALFTLRNFSHAVNAANNWARFILTGPANGTCPLWVRYFGVNYYIGMSDGTLWKIPSATTDIFPAATASSTITVTQVTLPAGISIDRRPVVVSATEMHFGGSSATGFPFVMDTSDVFTEYPDAIYPAELSFASAIVPNPRLVFKYGTTVNEYTVVDATNVYKTVANYSALDEDSFLFNGFTGSFERTGIVLTAGDILYAAQPADSNCVVQVYGYEED